MDPGLLALALLAGGVATFNPCGFALLPAYLAVLVVPEADSRHTGSARAGAVLRAVRFSAGMTAGFVLVFGVAGVLVAPLVVSLGRLLPVVTMVVGGVLMLLGLRVLAGGSLALPGLPSPRRAPGAGWASHVGYGMTFALASLSCTIAPFLAATTSALGTGSAFGVAATYAAYATGMGTVVTVLAITAAVTAGSAARTWRKAARGVPRLSGLLLLAAGLYVAWYGWFELRVLSDAAAQDPVVGAAIQVQSALAAAVASLGAPGIGAAAAAVSLLLAAVLWQRRGARRDPDSRSKRGPLTGRRMR